MRRRLASLALAIAVTGTFQQAPPDTEIFLAPIAWQADTLRIGPAINISNSSGYDNQPSFTPEGDSVLFTSVRGSEASPGLQTDIYRYVIASKTIARVTDTPTSEYSPTISPDGRHVSVVRVESDGTQRLWRFPLAGGQAELVLADIKPVGYHAWADATTLALFVLGKPATLQLADMRTGKADVLATDIGRSLQPIPGGGISFVQRQGGGDGDAPGFVVHALDLASRSATALIQAPGTTEPDLAWTPRGDLLVANKDVLYAWRKGQHTWRRITELSGLGLKGVTRLAVSPKGDWMAFVTAGP